MYEVEVFAFCKKGIKKTFKKTMPYNEFKKLKSDDYNFRAYQIGFNMSII